MKGHWHTSGSWCCKAIAAGLFSMGRRPVSKKAVAANTNGVAEEVDVKSPSTPQHDLGDMAGLKRGLDDCALNAVLDAGYEEDHFTSNVKIGVGSITIAIALIAQFYPKKHPENWAVLLACLILYCLGSALLSLFSALYEEDACFITRPKKAAGDLALRVSSRLPRYSDRYSLVVSDQAKHEPGLTSLWKPNPRQSLDGVEKEWSLTEFYNVDGVLHKELFEAEVQKLLAHCDRLYNKGN